MSPDSSSTDDGPIFLSELLRDFAHISQQQDAIEEKMMRVNTEQIQIRKRLDVVEKTLRAIGARDADMRLDAARKGGRQQGQRNTIMVMVAIFGPIVGTLASWFLVNTINAINYSRIDQERFQGGGPNDPRHNPSFRDEQRLPPAK